MKNPFLILKKRDLILLSAELAVIIALNLISGQTEAVRLAATVIGVTALIFAAKGSVWGQILIVVFSVLYGIISFECRYYGEMITYVFMSLPIAAFSAVAWFRHPHEYGKDVVAIHRLTASEKAFVISGAAAATVIFYFVLRYFDTPNLFFSTASVTTSFIAASLALFRSSFYALAYAVNDMVLIVLWTLMSMTDTGYVPVIACFVVFLINDLYAFVSWRKREFRQGLR